MYTQQHRTLLITMPDYCKLGKSCTSFFVLKLALEQSLWEQSLWDELLITCICRNNNNLNSGLKQNLEFMCFSNMLTFRAMYIHVQFWYLPCHGLEHNMQVYPYKTRYSVQTGLLIYTIISSFVLYVFPGCVYRQYRMWLLYPMTTDI